MSEILTRYSDTELAEFRALIEKKISKAEEQISYLESQSPTEEEYTGREGDYMDNATNNNDAQMIEILKSRQHKHLLDLKKALQRVDNKSYGICEITGALIDKRRLLAVLTTTKSLQAKLDLSIQKAEQKIIPPKPISTNKKIITKVIKKVPPLSVKTPISDVEEDELDKEYEDFMKSIDSYIGENDDDDFLDVEDF